MTKALSISCGLLVFMAMSLGVRADFNSYPYSTSGCPASSSNEVDPVTVVFYGNGSGSNALSHVQTHTGWSNQQGGSQNFSSHGNCGAMIGQRASGCDECTRFHIRVRTTNHSDVNWGVTSVGTPHHEDFVNFPQCLPDGGHAVDKGGVSQGLASGFDQGREAIKNAMIFGGSHHNFAGSVYSGNTREFKQCDNDYAGSNGNTYWISIS